MRYEARLVALELRADRIEDTCEHYWPIVDQLRDSKLVADQIAERLRQSTALGLSKVHIALAMLALFIPSVVGAVLTALLVRGHL